MQDHDSHPRITSFQIKKKKNAVFSWQNIRKRMCNSGFFPHRYFSENSFPYAVSTALPRDKQRQIRPQPATGSSRGRCCLMSSQPGGQVVPGCCCYDDRLCTAQPMSPAAPEQGKKKKKKNKKIKALSPFPPPGQKSLYKHITRQGSTRIQAHQRPGL